MILIVDYEPPPEPAPPEIPPRAQSLLTSLTKKLSSHTMKVSETGDLKHEEFIPQNQQGKQMQMHFFNLLKLKMLTSTNDHKTSSTKLVLQHTMQWYIDIISINHINIWNER